MSQLISRPLLALLLATSVTSAVVLLKPSEEGANAEADLVADRAPVTAAVPAGEAALSGEPWRRELPKLDTHTAQALQPAKPAPLPPPPPMVVTPVVQQRPVAPPPPFTYLGRLIRDGKTVVFLAVGDTYETVAVGTTVGTAWKVEGVTETGLQLRYLPLNESKQLALNN